MAETSTLQGLIEESLAEFPRLLATRLMRDKLEPFGCADNQALVDRFVDLLLAGGADGTVELNEEFDEALPAGAVIEFDKADLAALDRVICEFKDGLPDLLRETAEKTAVAMLRRYKRDWRGWRQHALSEIDGFRANLEARWGKGFDLLRMLIELSRDQGSAFHRRAVRSRSRRHANLNTALYHLHARAIQIASEIMTLMEGGFADGAMARWRTLHEVTCVAMVLSDAGDELSERYLLHEVVEARKALGQYRECHVALGYAPFSEREAARIEREFEAVIKRYGKAFGGDYGWVAAHLGVARPNFSQIEDAAGRAMMRSHYKMASHNVHAGAKGIAHRLSAFEGRYSAIAGASNVGFVEPGQNLGLSLLHFTTLLLPRRWTLDRIALLTALGDLQAQIGPALARSDRAIARDERRIRRGESGLKSGRRREAR